MADLQGVRSAVSGFADGGIEAVRVSYDPVPAATLREGMSGRAS
jgi:hypothetical protein